MKRSNTQFSSFDGFIEAVLGGMRSDAHSCSHIDHEVHLDLLCLESKRCSFIKMRWMMDVMDDVNLFFGGFQALPQHG